MHITLKKPVKKFQQGGPVGGPAMGGAPVQGGGQEEPMAQLVQIFAEGLQNQDCQALAQGAEMFLQLVQQAGEQQMPQEEQGEPVFKKGGRLSYRIKK